MTSYYTDEGAWQEQAGYSRAVRRGNIVMVSGTTATGPDGTALGAGLEDIIRTSVYLAPGASWEQAAAAHREILGDVRPANTMLYVGPLIGDGFLVEIEAQAVVDP